VILQYDDTSLVDGAKQVAGRDGEPRRFFKHDARTAFRDQTALEPFGYRGDNSLRRVSADGGYIGRIRRHISDRRTFVVTLH